ncbi:hypothetical protein FOMPIDRAFT_1022549 [Fomitopsis schrenkii]|uniref:Uncharacterized protein n=1 Tax=Fomitopsis schrenkii TaxID=2126942 RepID=S8EE40_FOMSC|nr:hypothetical protein FOMPIDRAFT_1022549 [Fomitopsis schrenkii]
MTIASNPAPEAENPTIASADEPKPDLPPPLKARTLKATVAQCRVLTKLEPFVRLPRILVPIPGHTWQPPTMHYGWKVRIEALLAYAREHQLTQTRRRIYPGIPDLFEESSGTESEPEPEPVLVAPKRKRRGAAAKAKKAKPKDRSLTPTQTCRGDQKEEGSATTATRPRQKRKRDEGLDPMGVNVSATISLALTHVVTRLNETQGLGFPLRYIALRTTLQSGANISEYFIVATYSNYDLRRDDLPTVEQIKKVGEALGETDDARWYVDGDHYVWRPNPPRL